MLKNMLVLVWIATGMNTKHNLEFSTCFLSKKKLYIFALKRSNTEASARCHLLVGFPQSRPNKGPTKSVVSRSFVVFSRSYCSVSRRKLRKQNFSNT
jgi:hypothetical protein